MKKHYVSRWEYDNKFAVNSACNQTVFTVISEATYRKQSVKCKNCRRTKVFRGVK